MAQIKAFEKVFNKPGTKKLLFGNSEKNKLGLYLVYLGLKPTAMCFVFSPVWKKGEKPTSIPKEKIDTMTNLLDSSGCAWERLDLTDNPGALMRRMSVFLVGKNEETLSSIKRAWTELNMNNRPIDDRALGLALGYPKTAVDAFGTENAVSASELPEEYSASETVTFELFIFSKTNYKKEFELVESWSKAVARNNSEFHKAVIEQYHNK